MLFLPLFTIRVLASSFVKSVLAQAVSNATSVEENKVKSNSDVELPSPINVNITFLTPAVQELALTTCGRTCKHGFMDYSVEDKSFVRRRKKRPSTTLHAIENPGAWVGPTRESNWVIPGHLLVGAYPFQWEWQKNFSVLIHKEDLHKLLNIGVRAFVCLQAEITCHHQNPEGTLKVISDSEELKILRMDPKKCSLGKKRIMFPYFEEAKKMCRNPLRFLHLPIIDLNCTDDDLVLDLALHIVARIQESDEKFYMHCWGGHGRTGTLVAVILSLYYEISAQEALQRTQIYHNSRRAKVQASSPQTVEQCNQVRRIVSSAAFAQALEGLNRSPGDFLQSRFEVRLHVKESKVSEAKLVPKRPVKASFSSPFLSPRKRIFLQLQKQKFF